MSPDSALALLEAWRRGDEAAGEELFRRYFSEILRFFKSKVGVQAEDLVQQTVMECVKTRHQFRGDSSFRTYLFAIARPELYRHIRRQLQNDRIDFDVSSISPGWPRRAASSIVRIT